MLLSIRVERPPASGPQVLGTDLTLIRPVLTLKNHLKEQNCRKGVAPRHFGMSWLRAATLADRRRDGSREPRPAFAAGPMNYRLINATSRPDMGSHGDWRFFRDWTTKALIAPCCQGRW